MENHVYLFLFLHVLDVFVQFT